MITLNDYLLFFIELFLFYLVLKSIFFYRSFGINPVRFLNRKNKKEFFAWQGMMLVLLSFGVLIVLQVMAYDIGFKLYFLEYYLFNFFGILFTIIGFVMMVMAHQQMGEAWRMGIDEGQKTILVSRGLYSISRNPIYVALLLQAFGLVLLLKSIIALVLLFILILNVRGIISQEELFLERHFGISYKKYKELVRRYV
jgi:protein-S-isoprenylcysteine O-methyltransferase Ste14